MRKLPFFEKNKRRALVYGPRAMRMITRGGLSAPCCFMHVPKSGGTSVTEALHALAPIDKHIRVVHAIPTRRAAAIFHLGRDDENAIHEDGPNSAPLFAMREQMVLTGMAHDDALIHGHFLFSEKAYQAFGDRYRWATMLRDPIARVVSNFKDARRAKFFEGDFDAYLESGVARRHAQLNLRYFSGAPEIAEGDEAAALETALANLARFAVVGFLDRPDAFQSDFAEAFGARPSMPHYNVGAPQTLDLTAEQRARVERFAAEDLAIFETARSARFKEAA